jgi:hypothetical protein
MRLDILVDSKIIIEVKSTEKVLAVHRSLCHDIRPKSTVTGTFTETVATI